MNIFLISLVFLVLFLIAEMAKKILALSDESARKAIHIASGCVIFFLPYYLSRNEGIILAIFFAVFLIATKKLGILPSIHRVSRETLGEVYFPLALAISAYLFLPDNIRLFQFGILVLAFSDGLAALVGKRYGKHSLAVFGAHMKSVEGSLAFFISTLILFIIFLPPIFPLYILAIVASLILTFLEFYLVFGLDNLFLPIVAGYLLYFILH